LKTLKTMLGVYLLGVRLSFKPHENIRVQVAQQLRDLLRDIVEKMWEASKNQRFYTLLMLLRSPEGVTVLMPQEVRVGDKRRWVDIALGNKIVFEFKSGVSEFDEAERDAREKYWDLVSRAEYFIVTNWDQWRICRVTGDGLALMEECDRSCDRGKALKLLDRIIRRMRDFRISPIPENIEALYKLHAEELLEKLRNVYRALREKVKPHYEAYRNTMSALYAKPSKGLPESPFIEDLFIRHTYMQMAVLASLASALNITGETLEAICSGLFLKTDSTRLDIALPYLNWWKSAMDDDRLWKQVEEILEAIVKRAEIVDWSLGAEDTFRALYEFLIEPEVRRDIGEYYTPLWLVEFILNKFDLKSRIVLDPFCGSGTFLVKAFHRKVDLGEDPGEAFNEVVGFDVNPLAVTVARAELILAYLRRTGRLPENPPHIYHIDTLSMWFEGPILPVPLLSGLIEKIKNQMGVLARFDQVGLGLKKPSDILAVLRVLEKGLTRSLNDAYYICGLDVRCLEKKIEEYLEKNLEETADLSVKDFLNEFMERFKEGRIASDLAGIIASYEGNGVWGAVLAPVLAATIMGRFKPDIIATNPPWIPTSEFKTQYADKIRGYMLSKIKAIVPRKAGSILNGSDVASAALGRSLDLAGEGVAYIMNREQLFRNWLPERAGILASYAILKSTLKGNTDIEIFDFDFDVFGHGVRPAVIIVKKKGRSPGTKLYVVRLDTSRLKLERGQGYSKSLELDTIRDYLEEVRVERSYDEYARICMAYFNEDFDRLAKELNVNSVHDMGLYIRGIYGGERKKGEERYAGIVLKKFHQDRASFWFKLWNTEDELRVPLDMLRKYGIKVYKMIYMGEVDPFKLRRFLNVILSERGVDSLKQFLREALEASKAEISSWDTVGKVRKLADEVIQPSSITTLDTSKYYVIYRGKATFTAFAFKPDSDNIIVKDEVGYMECDREDIAYYYAAVLNYLAHKVIEFRREFVRDQYGRPIPAIFRAGLAWKDVDEAIRSRVVKLSKILHEKAQEVLNKRYSKQRMALKEIAKIPEFRELMKTLDSKINKEDLEKALKKVSKSK